MKCDTCEVEFFGKPVSCKCTTYVFCGNACYNQRPFRDKHKPLCERRAAITAAKKIDDDKQAKKNKQKKAAEKRPRGPGGKFARDRTKVPDADELEKRAKHNLNVQVGAKVAGMKKNAIGLQNLKPHWKITCAVVRTDKYSKKDSIIYQTGTDVPAVAAQNENMELEDAGGGVDDNEIYHLEESAIDVTAREGSLRVYCYICHKKIATVKESLRCQSKLEDGEKCLEGACHKNCVNITWNNLSNDTWKEIKSSYYCGAHRRKNQARNDESGGDSGGETDAESSPHKKATKPRAPPTKTKAPPALYNLSDAVKALLPAEERQTPKTRAEVVKLINNYIKEKKLQTTVDSVKQIQPDALLMPVYGFDPLTTKEIGSSKLSSHLKRTIPLPNPSQTPIQPANISNGAGLSIFPDVSEGDGQEPQPQLGHTSHPPSQTALGLAMWPGGSQGDVLVASCSRPPISNQLRSCQLPAPVAQSSRPNPPPLMSYSSCTTTSKTYTTLTTGSQSPPMENMFDFEDDGNGFIDLDPNFQL